MVNDYAILENRESDDQGALNVEAKMADEVVAAGKSKQEVTFMLMRSLLHASDGPANKATRNEILDHYAKARNAVSGGGSAKF